MILLHKPISSPSRTDKFPPPLLRFLKSNGGSRSRGRSRSSPIFIRKKAESGKEAQVQEPSSPKVTCMGQVRVSRAKQKAGKSKSKTPTKCWWIRKVQFWKQSNKWKPFDQPFWARLCSCSQKVEMKKEGKRDRTEERTEEEEEEDGKKGKEGKEGKVFVSMAKTPPKNALLLMRCRSEPYRASSLANRFWGSPEQREEEEEENPISKEEPICRDSETESRKGEETEEKLGFFSSTSSKEKKEEETEKTGRKSGRPMVLTRCKSVPARTSERHQLDLETCFWNNINNRLAFVDISTTRF